MRGSFTRSNLLFLSLLLASFQLKASSISRWQDVPTFVGTGTVTNLEQDKVKVISRMGEGSELTKTLAELLGDEIWKRQEDLTDAVFRGFGDISVDLDLIDKRDFSAGLSFSPKRKIYFFNAPYENISQNGKHILGLNNERPSKYFLYNSLEGKIRSDYEIINDIGEIASKKVGLTFGTDFGLGIYHLESAKSPRQLPPLSDEGSLLEWTDTEKKELSPEMLKKGGFFTGLGNVFIRVFDELEKFIYNTSDKISDEDSSELFFRDLFDSIRLPGKFPINADSVRKKMAIGDVLTVSVFGGAGPSAEISSGVIRSRLSGFIRAAYQVTVKKVDENRVLVRPKLVLRKGIELAPAEVNLSVGIGAINLSFTPFSWRMEGSSGHSLESLLEYDLSNPDSEAAFNEAVLLSFKRTGELLKEKGPFVKVSDRIIELTKRSKRQVNLNIGIAKLAREKSREVTKHISVKSNGEKETIWLGSTMARSLSRLRLFKKEYEIDKVSQTMIRTNLDERNTVIRANVDENSETPLGITNPSFSRTNMTVLSDKQTTKKEFERMLELVRISIGSKAPVLPSEQQLDVQSFYSRHKNGHFSVTLLTKFADGVLTEVLKLSPKQFWKILAETFLVNPKQSLTNGTFRSVLNEKDRTDMNIAGHTMQWANCKVTSSFDSQVESAPCRFVWVTINHIGRAFEKIIAAKNDEDRLKEFTKMESFLGISPALNAIIFNAYNVATGGATPDLAHFVRVVPPAGSGINIFVSATNENFFDNMKKTGHLVTELDEIKNSDNRIKDGELFVQNEIKDSKIYLSIQTPALIQAGQRVSLWLADHIVLKKDRPLATAVIRNLIPQDVSMSSHESFYRYEMEIPQSMVELLPSGKSELQVRIENSKGEPLSELVRFEIRKK